MNLEEREQIVADAYTWLDETNARVAAAEAEYQARSAAIQRAMALVIEQANAPWRALIHDLSTPLP